MRKMFHGYYQPTAEEFERLWSEGLLAPDNNVLIHLFRFMPKQREEVLAAFKSFGNRLWLPYQVANEFHQGWRSAESANRGAYSDLKKDLAKKKQEIEDLVRRFSRFDPWPEGSTMNQIPEFFDRLSKDVDGATSNLPNADEVLAAISDLFEGKVAAQPEQKEIDARVKEAERRMQNKIPPGYMDKRPGDYLIWAELKEKARTAKLPIIFVTDDRKEDWWLEQSGKTIGPRPELRQEFTADTGQMFYAYTPDRFLALLAERTKNLVSPETVMEMQRIQSRRLTSASSLRIRSEIRELLDDILLKPGANEEALMAYAANIATALNLIEPTVAARAQGKETGDDPALLQQHADDLKSDAISGLMDSEDSEMAAHNLAAFNRLIDLLRDREYRNELEYVLNRLATTRALRERMEENRNLRDVKRDPDAS